MYDINTIKHQLETQFPDLSFTIGRRIYGECIIAKKTKYSGADIFIKKSNITVEAAIPEMKTRMLLGAGAVFLKLFSKNYKDPSIRIKNFLMKDYDVKLRE